MERHTERVRVRALPAAALLLSETLLQWAVTYTLCWLLLLPLFRLREDRSRAEGRRR